MSGYSVVFYEACHTIMAKTKDTQFPITSSGQHSAMIRLPCFNTHIQSHKPKNSVESSFEEIHKTSEDRTKDIALQEAASVDTSLSVTPSQGSTSASQVTKSEKREKEKFDLHQNISFYQTGVLRKTQSTGSRLCMEGKIYVERYVEDEIECGLSSDSVDRNGLDVAVSCNYDGMGFQSVCQEASWSNSVQISSYHVENGSNFSIGDTQNPNLQVHEHFDSPFSGQCDMSRKCADGSDIVLHHKEPALVKSLSLPNIASSMLSPWRCSKYSKSFSRSLDDLYALEMWRKEISTHGIEMDLIRDQQVDKNIHQLEEDFLQISNVEAHDSYCSDLVKDWIVPVTDEIHSAKSCGLGLRDETTSKEFKIKRIEEWVDDLQHCNLSEECGLSKTNDDMKDGITIMSVCTITKDSLRESLGADATKRCISSLSASATKAELSNCGLVVIPFLSAFVNLRTLNLSGNGIAKITAGALPRGLHMLYLAKNNISSIEGLRELTRLRVLDLSFNRITKIGHGLASCSSLKELYLAGNKISEVEGLHRLLKLSVLDMRYNKLPTTKCLGQLAANYSSLQAISLEGNPAQKNVGDEQIKKYLHSLLPHLTYFNRQSVKAGTSKDSADHLLRIGTSGHQFDRGSRSDNKAARKGNHLVAQKKAILSSSRRGQVQVVASHRHSRDRHGYILESGSKSPEYYDGSGKMLDLKSQPSIRRTMSEGMFSTL